MFLISGLVLLCLLFILIYFGRHAGQETPPHKEAPLEAPQALSEPYGAQGLKPSAPLASTPEEPPPASGEGFAPADQQQQPSIEDLIKDLRDDDVRYNAGHAIYELRNRLPDDTETVNALIEALRSDDWQQRQIAGYILARWATHTDLRGNRQFLKVMVEALQDNLPLSSMYSHRVAENYLSARSDYATDLLQSALTSQDNRQRTYAAFILAVGMNVHPGNRLQVEEVLNDPSADNYLPRHYRQGALAMCALQTQRPEHLRSHPVEAVADHVYVIGQGDILSNVAWAYQTDWRMLAMYNGLPDPDRIEPGLEIFIPGTLSVRAVEEPEPVELTVVEVKDRVQNHDPSVYEHVLYPGETIEDVARQYGSSLEEILTLNGITEPKFLRPGDRLLVPVPP